MRLTIIILIASLMQVSAATFAQLVTLNKKNVQLETVLKDIRQQTGYDFYYDGQLTKGQKIDINVNKATVDEALKAALKDLPLNYTIDGQIISITKKAPAFLDNIRVALAAIDVHGRVVDEKGQPMQGVTVKLKDESQIITTDKDGSFILKKVNENSVIVISFIGFLTKEVNARLDLGTIALEISNSKLDEVQIIAYGTTTRRLSTGNSGTLKASDIEKQPVGNPLLALEGRVSGIFIEQASGLPGSGVKVRIQGQNSITKGNDPLYVVDGVPYISQLLPSVNGVLGSSGDGGFNVTGNPLSFLNSTDIESIDVLKDADATSIYGSRAANGAILITTKKGKAGQTNVDVNLQNGWGNVTRKLDLLNTQQYLEMRKEAIKNDGIDLGADPYNSDLYKVYLFPDLQIWDQHRQTNWQEALIGGTAKYTNFQASISGGSSNTTFLIGANYNKQTTVFPGDANDKKGSVHFSLNNSSINNKFKVSLTANYLIDDNLLQNYDLTNNAITLPPNAPALKNADGSLNWEPYVQSDGSIVSSWYNPLALLNNPYRIKTNNLITNSIISYKFLPGLTIQSNFGYTNMQNNEFSGTLNSSNFPENRALDYAKGTAIFGNGNSNSWTVEPQLNFQHSVGEGKIDLLLGTTWLQQNQNKQILNASGFSSDLQLENISAATTVVPDGNIGTTNSKYKYNAVYGRLNYNLSDKYIVNLSVRRDGSSRFGAQNKFHNFGSVGAAWIFSEEKLFESLSFLSFGKLRGSFGTTGNDQIGDYSFLSLYDLVNGGRPYQGTNGLLSNGLPNQYLQWEETKKLQFGVDLGFLKDRLLISGNYYDNRSSNQLLNYLLPSITGQVGITQNFPATVQNTGWELNLSTVNVKTDLFRWSTNINLTIPKNELKSFQNLAGSPYANVLIVGQPVNIQKLYKFGGVDPASGLYQFYDKNSSLTTTPGFDNENKIIVYDPNPKFFGGIQNSLSYRNFQLDFSLQFVKQTGNNYLFGSNPGQVITNQPVSVLNRWQNVGDVASIQRYNTYFVNVPDQQGFAQQSDKAYSDASYIRLKNVSLSWQLPESWRKRTNFQNARLYVQGQNLLTITNYLGLDPENRSTTSLPPLRVITLGIQVSL